jgi:hypothetical protein
VETLVKNSGNVAVGSSLASQLTDELTVRFEFGAIGFSGRDARIV